MSAEPIIEPFDWRKPDYDSIVRARIDRLARMRAAIARDPSRLPALHAYYAQNIAQFICDWGTTTDPRSEPVLRPLILFPRQRELVAFILERLEKREPGVVVKSRDVGASVVSMAVSCALCLFNRDYAVGVISAKEALLDRSGDPDTLFFKARQFLANLPTEFRGGFDAAKHSADQRILIPATGSTITGSIGDDAGRGGRKRLVFVDESAHIARPMMLDAALASVTNVRIDMSSVCGVGNSFAQRARDGRIPRFDLTWRSDPRKDEKWYAKVCSELDPVTVAQEYDADFLASTEGQLIPSAWVQAAVDVHKRLGIEITGMRVAAFDPADQGIDRNAFAVRRGILLERVHSWSGKSSDIYASTVKAFALCREAGTDSLYVDVDGLGAGVVGDARAINQASSGVEPVRVTAFRGSAAVEQGELIKGRKNQDYFANQKAMSWMALRQRFEKTYRATQGHPYNADDLISISSECGELTQLVLELSQPTYHLNNAGKILIDKAPDGARSPNLGDAVMMCFSPITRRLEMWHKLSR